jgi:8-oxo-dGTP pyrophosphatase MutT (NUDIX family)
VVVFDPDGRVLLIQSRDPARRNRGHWWEIPGGGIDPGEATADAVARELWEEAGIREARVGPVVWTQAVNYTFAGWRFEQDEFIHVAHSPGGDTAPEALEYFESLAFGEQRWWHVEDVVEQNLRTIPYRMSEFLLQLRDGHLPTDPIDITPTELHVEHWHRRAEEANGDHPGPT